MIMNSTTVDADTGRPSSTPAFARLLNVFTCPGEVFEEVLASPHLPVNWLLPIFLNCILGGALFLAGTVDSAPTGDTVEGSAAISKAPVPAGAVSDLPSGPPGRSVTWRCAGLAAGGALGAAGTFWSALVLWSVGRVFLKTRFSYLKTLEIAGLAGLVSTLGTVVMLLLKAATGNASAQPALSLLLAEFNSADKLQQTLAALNVFHFWLAAVLSIGLAKLSAVSVREAAVWVFGYWIVLRWALIALG